MSDVDGNNHVELEVDDHQPVYIHTTTEVVLARPRKRRKLVKPLRCSDSSSKPAPIAFTSLLHGAERAHAQNVRHELYQRSWAITHARIQDILDDANEGTLSKVMKFVKNTRQVLAHGKLFAGFITTGPNIASQNLLFKQLAYRLKAEINGPVMTLRSADSPNLKAALKQLIRDGTYQKYTESVGETPSLTDRGQKLLNYDLELLHDYVRTNCSDVAVVVLEDSEAFDSALIADMIVLFKSWIDRIPFVLLIGVATSVSLFQERLPRSASRCIDGIEFEVEQTAPLLERIFARAVAGLGAPLRLSPAFMTTLMERQEDHSQSIQSFTTALQYAYMCHYYFDALSIFNPIVGNEYSIDDYLQHEHLEAIRMLPSFHTLVDQMLEAGTSQRQLKAVRDLFEDDQILKKEIEVARSAKPNIISRYLRAVQILAACTANPISQMDLYLAAFEGSLEESDYVQDLLDAIKRMSPSDLLNLMEKIHKATRDGAPALDLPNWEDDEDGFVMEVNELRAQAFNLIRRSSETGKPLRSSYAIHNRGVRTTVIAQRVQLSYEKSVLTQEDQAFMDLVDRLSQILLEYFTLKPADDVFLNELWTADHVGRYREVFSPRPRASIEYALSAPYEYLGCDCCEPIRGLSPTHPPSAILYQMYLETGSLVNIFDLWSAFLEMVSIGDESKTVERAALVMFYTSLSNLKVMGMIKHSKKKVDHLAKLTGSGL